MTLQKRRIALLRCRAARNVARPRTELLYDSFTQGATQITLDNHTPDRGGQGLVGAAWAQNAGIANPSKMALGGASATTQQNQIYNQSSGTFRALYYCTIDPGTTDYRVTGGIKQVATNAGGNREYACARMSQTADTFYGANVSINSTGGPGGLPSWEIILIKHITGTETVLATAQLGLAPTLASGEVWEVTFDCSNDEKVVYARQITVGTAWKGAWNAATAYAVGDRVYSAGVAYQRLAAGTTATAPAADATNWSPMLNYDANGFVIGYSDFPVRVASSPDNSINAAGNAGVHALRSNFSSGQHMVSFKFETNGPQAQVGTSPAASADPVQAPALLWTPDYSTPRLDAGNTGGAPWYREQEPYVRGVAQPDRLQVVAAGSVPGSGTYKPVGGALRAELRAFNTGSDFTVAATAAALATDTTITMSSVDVAKLAFDATSGKGDFLQNRTTGEVLRVSAAPSGTSVPVLRAQSTTAAAITSGDVFDVPTGDVSDSGGSYEASRCEVFDRFPLTGGGTIPSAWPDPVGTVRYYGVSYFIPVGFDLVTYSGTNPWITLDQWKGQFGGSPPRSLGLDVKSGASGQWILDGAGAGRTRLQLGAIVPGQWTRFVFGFRWETSAVNGWVMAWRDGALVVPKRSEATMDTHSSGADPIYYKNGIYRTKAWNSTHVIHIGPPKVGTTFNDVVNA